ncbi:MAG: site-specific integrase [Alistipes sp.]|nr:site-specific integrase [Alistipes sp.]
MKSRDNISLCRYAAQVSEWLYGCGRVRAAETYMAAVKSFMNYRGGEDIPLCKIDSQMVVAYQYHLRNRGLSANTISFYIRNLRAIYNRAVEDGLVANNAPFRRAYTGTSKTAKRALRAEDIRRIAQLDLQDNRRLQFAADIFLFSLYTRGMAFVDIAHLRWSDIRSGYLVYNRRKTGQQIVIKWERCMAQIAERYFSPSTPYIFPIIKGRNPRREYLSASHAINSALKTIGTMASIATPLTLYVARHSWASIAYAQQVSVATISRALGHNNESTTRIYLASLDNSAVDIANKIVLKSISF